MDATAAAEARERVTKWIEETRHLFALLPDLLATDSQVNQRASVAEKEMERVKKEVEDLKRENHQLRAEKDEIAHAMGQIAQKLGLAPRKSPFERTVGGEQAPKPLDHARPGDQPKVPEHPKAAEHPKA